MLGSSLNDRYLIEKEIGRGGMGIVYLARDRQLLSKPVVVKVLQETSSQSSWLKKRFRQEIEALARIDHPGVVGILDAGEIAPGRPYLVMQYVDGRVLRSIMSPRGLSPDRVARIIRQASHALTAAHDKGVFHRDLKPENIMLQSLSENEEFVKIIDFGIATVKSSDPDATQSDTSFAGSLSYMAPEQINGKPIAASDTYALGVIAYEMLTGKRPYEAGNPVRLYALQRYGSPVKPRELVPGLPEGVETAILKALSFNVNDRHARARDFGEDLSQAITAAGGQPRLGARGCGSPTWATLSPKCATVIVSWRNSPISSYPISSSIPACPRSACFEGRSGSAMTAWWSGSPGLRSGLPRRRCAADTGAS